MVQLLLVSTYELGRQPLSVASAVAALDGAGHEITTLDLAVDEWDDSMVETADAVAISVPMHTATRLATQVIERLETVRPGVPIALFGLYATVPEPIPGVAAIAGDFAEELKDWAQQVDGGHPDERRATVRRRAVGHAVPRRTSLPPLSRYARLLVDGEQRLAGYAEASHGCRHRCRHCPVPVVYDGRINIVDVDAVIADVDQQVSAGARHITFGDPDFLNAPAHSRRVVERLHRRHPSVTFDVTVKVEHILTHADIWREFSEQGCIFAISAFEVLNDRILQMLDKGHTATDAGVAVHTLRDDGIEIRPSWLPFTPWTSMDDVVDIFRFIADHDLVENTDPVQLSIRLLIPSGSLILDLPDMERWLGVYDPPALTYRWTAQDPAVDELQRDLAELAESGVDQPPRDVFNAMWQRVATGALIDPASLAIPAGATVGRPRMTEAWFC